LKNNFVEHIYIHVPFCLRKCGYCSFYSEILDEKSKYEYLQFLLQEIKLWQQKFILKPKTIYFGGGTPSLLSGDEIDSIINCFDLSQIEEVTLEANPANITEKYAEEISQTKINRISLGIQSFQNNELKLLGRIHDSSQAEKAHKILRKSGFRNISFDLIYGLPNQTEAELLSSIEKFIELGPEHISTYCLSLEEDVPMYPMKSKIPTDKSVSDFYNLIRENLLISGYEQYEISSFSKPGFESKHNLCYWTDKPYLGLGPAAAGYLRSSRYTNPSNLEDYYHQKNTMQISQIQKILSSEDHEKEYIFLALRKAEGMNLKEFNVNFGIDFLKKYEKIVDKFQRGNLLEIEGDFIRLSPAAYFVSNEIFAEFM